MLCQSLELQERTFGILSLSPHIKASLDSLSLSSLLCLSPLSLSLLCLGTGDHFPSPGENEENERLSSQVLVDTTSKTSMNTNPPFEGTRERQRKLSPDPVSNLIEWTSPEQRKDGEGKHSFCWVFPS